MYAASLGNRVRFIADFVSEGGKRRAKKGDTGTIMNKHIQTFEAIVQVDGKYYPVHNVPLSILEDITNPNFKSRTNI